MTEHTRYTFSSAEERLAPSVGVMLIALVAGLVLAGALIASLVAFLGFAREGQASAPQPQNEQPAAENAVLLPVTSTSPVTPEEPEGAPKAPNPLANHPLVAHAGGAWRGGAEPLDYTNSLEALEQNYAYGLRVFEVDLRPTSDGGLALIHDWRSFGLAGKALSARDWASFAIPTKVKGVTLTPLLADGLLDFMVAHPDAYVICDTKDYSVTAAEANRHLKLLKQLADERDPALAGRLIPYVYGSDFYDAVDSLKLFDHLAVTAYATDMPAGEIINLAVGTDAVCAVCVDQTDKRFSAEIVERLEHAGKAVYLYTVNSAEELAEARARGVKGYLTDTLTPSAL